MTPEVPSALSPLIRRVVANNPGLMTGPGTNTYLVGIDEVAVIDPGPDVAKHVESIVGAAMRDRVRWVLLTHTHPDHWPAAERIRKKTGALVGAFGKFPKADEVKLDLDLVLADGDTIDGTEFRLEAMHTPGHAPNHLCFLLDEERTLFTGDHVLNGTTTVVNPQRGGDMVAVPRVARTAAQAQAGGADLPRSRRRDGGSGGGARRVRRAPQDARAPDHAAAGEGPGEDHRRRRARSTPTRPRACSRWRSRQVHAHLLKLKAEGKVTGTGAKSAWTRV